MMAISISDSTFIRAHIEQKYDFDLRRGLDVAVSAQQAWAIERMLENHFGWTMIYTRWIMPENFAKGPAHFFGAAPDHVRDDAQGARRRRALRHRRHPPRRTKRSRRLAIARCSALSRKSLADQRYLMGDRPTGVDATAFAMLAAVLTPFFDSPLRRRALDYLNLVAYVERMMALALSRITLGRARRAHQPRMPTRSTEIAQATPSHTSPRSRSRSSALQAQIVDLAARRARRRGRLLRRPRERSARRSAAW